ncbi:KilA-N domain-containing protein [Dyella sp. M7H15-1]|uniref:KilA-N domain-containing protein n=1 Tax=Dyella sp. M7H15-1 TaxID=2501295 RepID=UPI00197AE354|nr:KilA-N domain-containing protein [Dyella sp. M7H15-1]
MKNRSIVVQYAEIGIASRHEQDYISLTDMVKRFGDERILYGWLRNRNTVEFLGIWEQINNFEVVIARLGCRDTKVA